MLEIKGLHKSYGKARVLTDVNLSIEENKIYGLLGRNGVGKTTLLNIISNQIRRDSGELTMFGEELYENSNVVEDICLVREKGVPADSEKIKKIFAMAKILYKNWDEGYKDFLIKEFNLDVKKKYNKLSRGNQTIVGLIIGLASRSKLTIFDEPSLGLDAAHRDRFYDLLLQDMELNPRTVIISTHLIDEVTNLFEEVIILKDEKIYIKDDVSNIMERGYFLSGRSEILSQILEGKNVIHRDQFGLTEIIAIYDDLNDNEKSKIREQNIEISSIPLQKLFIYLTESSGRKEEE